MADRDDDKLADRPLEREETQPAKDPSEAERDRDRAIIQRAKDEFQEDSEWESEFRNLYIQDVKFANADADNGWQWPDDLRREREINKRPALTINKTAQQVMLITNDARKNKPSVKIKPASKESSFKAAQIYEGLVRHIEYTSTAQVIYDDAVESQVEGGIGYWRVITEYESDETFDQRIRIAPVQSHLGVLLDRNIKMKDGSDAMRGFIFEDVPVKQFERQYPTVNIMPGSSALGESDDWIRTDYVRVAEYYRIVLVPDKLIYMEDGSASVTVLESNLNEQWRAAYRRAKKDPNFFVKERPVNRRKLEWYKIAGSEIIARKPCPGMYIPIVRVVGKERVIDGKLERKGHVRQLKDPQRMYNYNSSGQVEFGALQTKSPWVGDKLAFEGNEVAWNNANRQNAAYLTYNSWDPEHNREIKAPQRPDPPGVSPAFVEGMRIASAEMEMAGGQFLAQQQNPNIERTPKAIGERQRQGETSTYHFIDNLALAIRLTGKIIIDLVPHIYDTKRVIQIMGLDGTESKVTIDPNAQEAVRETKTEQEITEVLFNPKVGKYEVEADVGPAYATRRQEAWNAFVQIVTGSPETLDLVGDLMFRSADFPLADEIAERFKKKIKVAMPWLFDDEAPTPAMLQLKGELEAATQQTAQLLEQLADEKRKNEHKLREVQVRAYEAESKRVTALSNAQPELNRTDQINELQVLIKQTLAQMLGLDITAAVTPIQEVTGEGGEPREEGKEGEEPPVEGAQRAPDGKFYVPDPERPGKYLQVEHRSPYDA